MGPTIGVDRLTRSIISEVGDKETIHVNVLVDNNWLVSVLVMDTVIGRQVEIQIYLVGDIGEIRNFLKERNIGCRIVFLVYLVEGLVVENVNEVDIRVAISIAIKRLRLVAIVGNNVPTMNDIRGVIVRQANNMGLATVARPRIYWPVFVNINVIVCVTNTFVTYRNVKVDEDCVGSNIDGVKATDSTNVLIDIRTKERREDTDKIDYRLIDGGRNDFRIKVLYEEAAV